MKLSGNRVRRSTRVRQVLVSQMPGSLNLGARRNFLVVCPNPDVFLLILFRSGQGGHQSEKEKFPEREWSHLPISKVLFRNFLLL